MEFEGFAKETCSFLRAIGENNNKEWFEVCKKIESKNN